MKKLVTLILFLFLLACSGQVFAAVDDTRDYIEKTYGGYRMVIDTDNQMWAREEWETKGRIKAQPNSYVYYFDRNGLAFQMEVKFHDDSPTSRVKAQRITPAAAIRIKDLKAYLPEVYGLVTSPKAYVFTTNTELSRNLSDDRSPLTLGVLVKQEVKSRGTWYTLVAINVKDEGRLVKNAKFVNNELFIQELSIERFRQSDLDDPRGPTLEWEWMKTNIFK